MKSFVKEVDWCHFETNSFNKVVFSSTQSEFTSWNHITDSLKRQYQLQGRNFDINENNWIEVCDGGKSSLKVNLVKKIGDWNQQHLNGMEMFYGDDLLKYADISSIQLLIKIEAEQTVIPTQIQIENEFKDLVTAVQIGRIETSKFNLGITLFEPGGTVSDKGDFNAFHILEIEEKDFNTWLEVNIALDGFKFYLEKNYEETSVKLIDFPLAQLKGIRLCAETHTGQVVRNLNPDYYKTSTPSELNKELSFSIGTVAFNTK